MTDLRNVQLTRPRQRSTHKAKKPRIAPTTMKTVPSGRLLVCMNGALDRFGTVTVKATTAPVRVGRPVRAASVVAEVPVIVGTVPEEAAEPDPVIETVLADELAVVVAEVVPDPVVDVAVEAADPVPVACCAVERFGKFVEAAETPIAKATATTIEPCITLMMC